VRAFFEGDKPTVEEAEQSLGVGFTAENRARVTSKFMFRAVALPILTKSEKKVWDFIVHETKASGEPPEFSEVRAALGISPDEIRDTLRLLQNLAFLKGDVGQDSIALTLSMAGSIASEAKGLVHEVILYCSQFLGIGS
jgi:hypothetical protein